MEDRLKLKKLINAALVVLMMTTMVSALAIVEVMPVRAYTTINSTYSAQIEDVTTDFAGGELVFYYKESEAFRIAPTFTINGNERTLNWVKQAFPQADYQSRVEKHDLIKYEFNLSGLTQQQVNALDTVNLYLTQSAFSWSNVAITDIHKNITIDINQTTGEDITIEHREVSLTFPNGIIWSFQDLIDSNFTLELDKTNKVLKIGNLQQAYDPETQTLLLDPTTQSSCGTLNTEAETYVLSQNLTATGTCFTIGASHIVLDGAGYNISYAQSSSGRGIRWDGLGQRDNVTMKNFGHIENGADPTGNSNSQGIYIDNGENNIIVNNTITTESSTSSSQNNHGIEANDGNAEETVFIYNNTITTVNGRLINAIKIEDGDGSIIKNNIIDGAGTAFSSPASAISLSNVNEVIIEHNDITCSDQAAAITAVSTIGSRRHNISYNNITCSSSYEAIRMQREADDSNITDNRVVHSNNNEPAILFTQLTHIPGGNKAWNNHFNVTGTVWVETSGTLEVNNMSLDATISATNIVGGSKIGGNYYANAAGTGHSETCTDSDEDGICDSSVVFEADKVVDFYPLTYAPEVGGGDDSPECAVSSTNNTLIDCSANLQCNNDVDFQGSHLELVNTGTFNVHGAFTNIDYVIAPVGCFIQGTGSIEYE